MKVDPSLRNEDAVLLEISNDKKKHWTSQPFARSVAGVKAFRNHRARLTGTDYLNIDLSNAK